MVGGDGGDGYSTAGVEANVLSHDANARVGAPTARGIGGHQAQPQDDAGGLLAGLTKSTGLWLPQTFSEHHEGHGRTWQSAIAGHHRIDYIGIPLHVRNAITEVRDEVLLTTHQQDHSLVMCACESLWVAMQGLVMRRPAIIDRHACAEAARAIIFRNVLGRCPVPDWGTHADDALSIHSVWARHVATACAPTRRRPAPKPWISAHTLELIQARAKARSALTAKLRQQSRGLVTVVLEAWRFGGICGHLEHARRPARLARYRSEHIRIAIAIKTLAGTMRNATAAIRADKLAHSSALARRAQEAAKAGDSKTLYQITRSLVPNVKKPFVRICAKDGEVLTDPAAIRGRWMQHFCELFDGKHTTFRDIQHQADLDKHDRIRNVSLCSMPLAASPTMATTRSKLASRRPGKAAGEDAIPPELLRSAASSFANAYLPLFWRAAWRLELPLAFRGCAGAVGGHG